MYTKMMKHCEEDTMKQIYHVFMKWKSYRCKMTMLAKIIYRFNEIPIKIPLNT
jgi:hypothetical protein